jgi:outer membrane lipoprotein-sorting protein
MKRPIRLLAAAIALTLSGGALADEVADILTKADNTLTAVKDQTYMADLQVVQEGKVVKTLAFTARLKGLRMKVIRFTAPGDLRGMTILTTEDNAMYVYIPSFQRVRRVAAHVRNQGFMGTDFSPEEFGNTALSKDWDGRIVSQDAGKWVIDLLPKPGNETTFAKQRIEVSKKHYGVTRIDYYDGAGKVAKTQIREDFKTFGAITTPMKITVKDLRTGSMSHIQFSSCTINTGLSDEEFTKRAIQRAD